MLEKNWDIFNRMERYIYEFENTKNIYKEEPECKHKIEDVDGMYVCTKCGCVEGFALDTDGIQHENKKAFRPYEKSKQLTDLMKRISGHYYLLKNGASPSHLILSKIPHDIKGIRKYLKDKKLNMKNDYYYWLLKNDITKKISSEHFTSWTKEFKKTRRISPKQFLYRKFSENPEYEMFVDLFAQKKDKIINQTQSEDC